MEELISWSDLYKIISDAKVEMHRLNLPLHVSHKEVGQRELPALATLESILMHLNSRGLLKTFVKVDYTKPFFECEESIPEEETPKSK